MSQDAVSASIGPFSPDAIAAEGLKPEEYEEIVRRLGRHPNQAELGMFGVMWSEHCCYKNSRPLLKQFPTTGDRILVGPGENAGVVDMGDGLRLAFKIESHNHPSAVEPFQGAATGVGGILRDIFTMGARPIAILNSLRFGDLEDARTRRLFSGVVAGISHYGNCLTGNERIIWRDNAGVHFDTIGNFVESRLPVGIATRELQADETVETLSIDPDTHKVCWQPVRRIFKRQTQTLITLRTHLGRSLTMTPDHPVMLKESEAWDVRPAHMLQVGDEIPLLTALPDPSHVSELDLLTHISPETHPGTYVQLPAGWLATHALRSALTTIEPSPVNRSRYVTTARFPLSHFFQLEPLLQVSRSQVSLFRCGKANYIKAVIQPDEAFARLLGYFASEGCVSRNGNTYKIIFVFAHHEMEYVQDVVQGLKNLGLRPCVEKRESSIAVYATSWLLGYYLKEVWQCGGEAKEKALPAFVFEWSSSLQREVLKGLLRGDGSLTLKTHGNHAKITFASSSRKLFEQALMLIQSQGVVPAVYERCPGYGQIGGRSHVRQRLWQLEVNSYVGLKALADVFAQERTKVLATALSRYQEGAPFSFPRFRKLNPQVAVVKIKSIEHQAIETDVYDIEVDQTHLFVTTSGIITHNCVGVPTVGGEVYFDPAYAGNPLVNAMALGLMETPEIVTSGAVGIGNPVLYVGSTTGRDGMGGASFASAELSDASIDDRPAVQVGDPFLEKSLIEACLEAFKTGAVAAAQDMGAAGITCSTAEMAAKGGVGIELDLDKIPVRETGMVPYEYLLSESQERMLFVAHRGREQELIEIFQRWGLHAVVAGSVIAEPIVRILFQGEIAAEIPATALADNTPIYHRDLLPEPPAYARQAWDWSTDSLPNSTIEGIELPGQQQSWTQLLLRLLDTPTIACKRWVYRQYDHQVMNNSVLLPGGADAAIVRLRPQETDHPADSASCPPPSAFLKGVAATVDCNARYVYLHPYEGAKMAVAEAARNLSCVGAEPLAVTDNLNFGSPEKPIGYWQLAEACRGLAEACQVFNTPVTGGNVSLYNETLDAEGNPQSIYPTPVVGMVGLVDDITRVCGQGWQSEGDGIYLLGLPALLDSAPSTALTLGGSEYLAAIHGTVAGMPPIVDFDLEQRVQSACRTGIQRGWLNSAHDCAEGGLAVALAECCIAGQRGAVVVIEAAAEPSSAFRFDSLLFAEGGARILVSVAPDQQSDWETYLQTQLGKNWQRLGQVGSPAEGLRISTPNNHFLIDAKIEEISDRWLRAIERRL
jgi:phosphoribosylformylglycinamidine synthase subunit PurL